MKKYSGCSFSQIYWSILLSFHHCTTQRFADIAGRHDLSGAGIVTHCIAQRGLSFLPCYISYIYRLLPCCVGYRGSTSICVYNYILYIQISANCQHTNHTYPRFQKAAVAPPPATHILRCKCLQLQPPRLHNTSRSHGHKVIAQGSSDHPSARIVGCACHSQTPNAACTHVQRYR